MSRNLRFAILEHDHPFLHWDLMLELDGILCTWRLQLRPDQPGENPAQQLQDHRTLYLDYEGPLSGDRGAVFRWDGGRLQWLARKDDWVAVAIEGGRLSGYLQLSRRSDAAAVDWDWSLRFDSQPISDWSEVPAPDLPHG